MIVFVLSLLDGRYLISQGANVGVVNSEGETPLDIAEEEAMVELLQNEINKQGEASFPCLSCTGAHLQYHQDVEGQETCLYIWNSAG